MLVGLPCAPKAKTSSSLCHDDKIQLVCFIVTYLILFQKKVFHGFFLFYLDRFFVETKFHPFVCLLDHWTLLTGFPSSKALTMYRNLEPGRKDVDVEYFDAHGKVE